MEKYWSLIDYVQEKKKTNDTGEKFTVRFSSVDALLFAAYKLVEKYGEWENQGMAMFPVDPEAFRFSMKDGKMEDLRHTNLKGFTKIVPKKDMLQEYTAPELLLSENEELTMTPEAQNWTLAVLLFQLFYHSINPMMGKDSMNQVFLNKEDEYMWYAQYGVFSMDSECEKNKPVHGVQGHLIKYWNFYPAVLQEAFQKTFTEGKTDLEKRMTPFKWKQVLNRLHSDYVHCSCGCIGFIQAFDKTPQGFRKCPRCQRVYYPLVSEQKSIYITAESKIYAYQMDPSNPDARDLVAEVVENRQKKGVFGIKNLSKKNWKGLFPNGEERQVIDGRVIPLWPKLEITMENGDIWSIRGE